MAYGLLRCDYACPSETSFASTSSYRTV